MKIYPIVNQILAKHIKPIDGCAYLVYKKLHISNPTNKRKIDKDVTNNDSMERMETRECKDLDSRRRFGLARIITQLNQNYISKISNLLVKSWSKVQILLLIYSSWYTDFKLQVKNRAIFWKIQHCNPIILWWNENGPI